MEVINSMGTASSLPPPRFSYPRYRRSCGIDPTTMLIIPLILTSGYYLPLAIVLGARIPFWMVNSPFIYLLRHTQWMRSWAVINVALGFSMGLGSKYLPEYRSAIGIFGAAAAIIVWSLFSSNVKRYGYLLFGEGELEEVEKEFDTRRVNTDPAAPWESTNDEIVAALQLSQTHPNEGIKRIRTISARGLNINARNSDGETIMDIARYHECSPMMISMLKNIFGSRAKTIGQ